MFLIKTSLRHSPIHGFGVFAEENIPKGTKVWEWIDGLDIKIDKEKFEALPTECKTFIKHYAWTKNDEYYLTVDNSRFLNHSETPNCTSDGLIDTTLRDIKKDEELTYNYWEFHDGKEL